MQGLQEKTTGIAQKRELVASNFGFKIEQMQRRRQLLHDWLLLLALPLAFLYLELILRLVGGDSIQEIPWVYLFGFSFAAGFVLNLLCLCIPKKKIGRIFGLSVLGLMTIFFLVEFFLNNTFQTYMDLASILNGIGDVATGFTGTAFSAIRSDAEYILLFLLPFILCLLFWGTANHPLPEFRSRMVLTVFGIAVICYLLPLAVIDKQKTDQAAYKDQFQLDSGIRNFGLLTGIRLEMKYKLFPNEVDAFTSVEGTDEENDIETIKDYGINQMEIDFDTLIADESDAQIQQIHTYVSGLSPSAKNAYTGMFAGKNLILITAEAFSAEAIDPERTPTLYRLANQGIVFTDYYQPAWGGSTSTGEYAILTGMVPTSGVSSMKKTIGQDLYFTIGNQLIRREYYSVAYHNGSYTYYDRNRTHENFGYSRFVGMGNGMEEGVTNQWPESDLEMMEYTVSQYIDQQPFSVYYMSVSGHCLYHPGSNAMTDKNWEAVENLAGSSAVKGYFASQLELEYGLEYLVNALEKAGIADDTVLVISTDHYPYGLEKSSTWDNSEDYLAELYGKPVTNAMERDHSALILWSGCLEEGESVVVDTPVYSLDILPTLSNLFGVEYDSRLLVGRDVFSDQEPLVFWIDYSWLTDKGWYDAASGVFTPKEGVTVSDDYVDCINAIVKNKVVYSKNVLDYDYFSILFEEKAL
ncbi:MAG: LTA synthase family protein [Oscillospiraceae bacterium]|jgi:lipoteichoic acid synthase